MVVVVVVKEGKSLVSSRVFLVLVLWVGAFVDEVVLCHFLLYRVSKVFLCSFLGGISTFVQ